MISAEIRRIVEEAHQVALGVLTAHRDALGYTSEILVRRETIERQELLRLLAGMPEHEVFAPQEPVHRPQPHPPGRPERPKPGRVFTPLIPEPEPAS